MRKSLGAFLTLVLCLAAFSLQAGEKKSLLIMLDGLRSDGLLNADAPNIKSLINETWADGYKTSYTYEAHTNLDSSPSSATNHVAIATGVTATKNRCFENGQIGNADWENYPSYMTRLRQFAPEMKTVWLYNWGEDADLQTSATYVGEPQGDDSIAENAVAFLNGTFPTKEGKFGTKWTAGDDPDALMLYIDSIDGAGHEAKFTPFSAKYLRVINYIDKFVGQILDAVKARPNFANEDWLIVVVSDHGGIDHGHGIVGSQNCYTVPLIVTGKNIPSGKMKGQPFNCDSAAYMMNFYTGSVPESFDGKVEEVEKIEIPASPAEGLVAYLPFENNFDALRGDMTPDPGVMPPEFVADGKIGAGIHIEDGAMVALGNPESLQFGRKKDFSVAIWFRTDQKQIYAPAFIANKDWSDSSRAGFVLASNSNAEGNAAMANLADGAIFVEPKPLEYQPNNEWQFCALTADRDGNAILYIGNNEGKLSFISDKMSQLVDINGENWMIGQDATGAGSRTFQGDLDEVMVWERALSVEEMNKVYQMGLAQEPITK